MKPQVSTYYSFVCGMILFTVSSILGSFNVTGGWWFVFVFTVPGFAYPLIAFKLLDTGQKVVMGITGALLNAFITYISMMLYGFTVFTAGPAMVLYFLIYRGMFDNSLALWKGIFIAMILGTLAGLPPLGALYNKSGAWDYVIISALYPLWQTLFAVTVKLSVTKETGNIIEQNTVTTQQ